ncbi:MAG: preprotein translocase subunit SecG [Candidatus Aminicenantes bacterium]|nr:preprotein translocase subunit SecG [Candidatus Aminicenantes bacterium]MDH5386685.1 preprotein translocase subunit SecG [Candidatus Aminicenantes bacterium]MDH5743792.1 preprotein translocase subunit SecG [Candidatus Aminicenantes bacterium]
MSALFLTIHIMVCIVLIIAILLQSGKSADLAGAFGGMGSQSVFGPRGAASLLSKATTVCAILFMITSLGLWILSAKGERSVLTGEEAPVEQKTGITETQKKEGEEKKAPEGTTEQKQEEKKTGEETKKQDPDKEKKKQETEKK